MSAATTRVAGAVVTLAILAGLAALSDVPYAADASGGAALRLTWRARVEPVEDCRQLTPAELERLPVHMRRSEVCEGRVPPHRLQVTLDGDTVVDQVVRAAGARQDRPIYVFHELPATPGTHRLVVWFARHVADSVIATYQVGGLRLDTTLTLAPRQATLVTYDDERRALVVRSRTTPD